MTTKKTKKKPDRKPRLKKLGEREIAPSQLEKVNGGHQPGGISATRYCTT